MTIEGRKRFPVRVRYAPEYRTDPEALGRVLVASSDGVQIPLGQLATIEHARGPAMISSENGLLLATVLLNVQGRDVGSFVADAKQAVARAVPLPPDSPAQALVPVDFQLEDRGLLPGDTLRYWAEAVDNSPARQVGRSREYLLRIPTRAELRDAAAAMLDRAGAPAAWGFKLPECLLVLDEILQAFPQARFIHMVRDPLATCLRRTHMTARLDNQIGQAALPAAYRYIGRPLDAIHTDAPAVHMALTSRHQIEGVLEMLAGLAPERSLQLRYEDLLTDPAKAIAQAAQWIQGKDPPAGVTSALLREVDPGRAVRTAASFEPEVEAEVAACLAPLRVRLGYASAE